ncbi:MULTISPECIES: SHOCT domain-containing protein [Pontibacillus]|uniref:SHOCT domain-containing protein n=1 Tax=Pontibacillus chungwhensis TaxID=265426 RepID=A0ABY8V1I9_9BACI|nr:MULTISPECIES: SHOCT domain-containing protein [Pontibacillus]MCD5324588.1 SHOCT domain-containing protein [Pontibacillus sp. HN14]WIF99117.1 SHOCT domain-containing protein [Pontibacillus chungwhensis]
MMNGQGMGGFGGMGFTWMLVIGIIFIAVAILLMKGFNSSKPKQSSSSLDSLKERLARGEISEEEYDRLKKKLEEH